MASACVNKIGMSPDNFLDCPPAKKYPSYGWLSPRISFSRDFPEEEPSKAAGGAKLITSEKDKSKESDPEEPSTINDFVDFEFRLEDPVNMLPADELFSDGKLVPLQLSMIRPSTASETTAALEVRSPPDTPKLRRQGEISATDPYLFSPKAPRCSSRWKELLGLKKKLYRNRQEENQKTTSSSNSSNTHHHKSLKHFLHRNSKSSTLSSSLDSSSSLSLPLLRETDSSESVSVSSSRLSLSSSSSGHEHDDLPRLSLDSEKPPSLRLSNQSGNASGSSNGNGNPPRVRVVKPRALSSENPMAMRVGRSPVRRAPESTIRGVSVDSPRMSSSGKIVFHSLERSSSSPSSFNGGPRYKHNRGMERSYSANVRVTPVLNVPVCSLRGSSKSGGVFGFPLFSSSSFQQKKEGGGGGGGSTASSGNGTGNRGQQNNSSIIKNRPDRT